MSSPQRAPGRSHLLTAGLLLVLVTFGVYAQVRGHAFVDYDDDVYVYENAVVLEGLSGEATNAEGLLGQADIDGGLVEGASLKADGFGKIIEVAGKLAQQGKKD